MSDTSLPSSIGRMTLCGSSLQVVPKTMRQQSKPHGVRRKRKQAFQRGHVSFGWVLVHLSQRRHSHQQTTGPRTSLSCLNTHLRLM